LVGRVCLGESSDLARDLWTKAELVQKSERL
jgi:hypothetical protein